MDSISGESKGHVNQQATVNCEPGSSSGAVSPMKEIAQIAELLSHSDKKVEHTSEVALLNKECNQISRPILSGEKSIDPRPFLTSKELKKGKSNPIDMMALRSPWALSKNQHECTSLANLELKDKLSGSFSGAFLKPCESSRQDFRQEKIQKWVSKHKLSLESSLPSDYYWTEQYPPQMPVMIREQSQESSFGKFKETLLGRRLDSKATRPFLKSAPRRIDTTNIKVHGLLLRSPPQNLNGEGNALKKRRQEVQARGEGMVQSMDAKSAMVRSLTLKKEPVGCRPPGSSGVIGRDMGTGNNVTVREWLGDPKRVVDWLECLHIFKQVLEHVCAAHSQGITLGNVSPSYFMLSSSHHVKCIDSASPKYLASKLDKEDVHNDETRQSQIHHTGDEDLPSIGLRKANISHTGVSEKVPSSLCNQSVAMNGFDIDGLRSIRFSRQRFCSQHSSNLGVEAVASSGTLVDARLLMENTLGVGKASGENYMHRNSTNMPILNSYQEDARAPAVKLPTFLEQDWYASPEELLEGTFSCSSDMYSLGVLFFELFAPFKSWDEHIKVMSDLRHRILPPRFLLEHPKEAAFCLWMLHPEPDLRPKARDVLHSELLNEARDALAERQKAVNIEEKGVEADLLLDFLQRVQRRKQERANDLSQEISRLTTDLEEVKRRRMLGMGMVTASNGDKEKLAIDDTLNLKGKNILTCVETSHRHEDAYHKSSKLMSNFKSLEQAYFLMRWKVEEEPCTKATLVGKQDACSSSAGVLQGAEKMVMQGDESRGRDRLGCFFDSLCKYARYSRFKVKATLRHGDLLNTANMVRALSFDRDQEYFATAGVCKRIKVFECNLVLNDNMDIHYPLVEMASKSELSSICWNSYIKSHIASSDYDGVVQLWDANRGQSLMQLEEHEKRVWSVDFSQADPTRLASGSDDGSVKIWSINQEASIATINTKVNVCSVHFHANSSHFIAFGSADYRVYCYDLRHIRVPWAVMANHKKTVSYVKFLDATTLVSASTDNTLKQWDLSQINSSGTLCKNPTLTYTGHKNEKNFVGLSVMDGYIACGSESNSVFAYHKSFPMPITSHKFGSIDPVSGQEIENDTGQFVSSVCWRGTSQTLVTANSMGNIKLLEMV